MRASFFLVQALLWGSGSSCRRDYYTCRNGGCIVRYVVCDGVEHCTDNSDEDICGRDYCPKFYHACANSSFCYREYEFCDGKTDCPDASDEEGCSNRACAISRCLHNACPRSAGMCCQTRNGKCVVDEAKNLALLEEINKTLVFSDGQQLHTLNLADGSTQFLARRENSSISALSHSANENTVYWCAESEIWKTELRNKKRPLERRVGRIDSKCTITYLAFEWITGNFYLVCESRRIIICAPHNAPPTMVCSRAIAFGDLTISSIAVHPNVGLMYILGKIGSRLQLIEARSDGSSSKVIYREKNNSSRSFAESPVFFDIQENMMWIVESTSTTNVSLITLKTSSKNETKTVTGIFKQNTYLKAVFPKIAILKHLQELYAVFLTEDYVTKVKHIGISKDSRLFSLLDARAQPAGVNHCENLSCEHLCVLQPGGAVCECASGYELMHDGSCGSPDGATHESLRELESTTEVASPITVSESHHDYLTHAVYLTTIISVIIFGTALWYCLSDKKRAGTRHTAEAKVIFVPDEQNPGW